MECYNSCHSLRQIDSGDFPTDCFSVREKRYLYQRNEADGKHIIPDRYEFLVYRLLRHRLEAGDLFCRDSVHFRSFEDDLVDDHQWANKDALLAQTGLALLAQPIQDRLAELKCQLEDRIGTVNQRLKKKDVCVPRFSRVIHSTTSINKTKKRNRLWIVRKQL